MLRLDDAGSPKEGASTARANLRKEENHEGSWSRRPRREFQNVMPVGLYFCS